MVFNPNQTGPPTQRGFRAGICFHFPIHNSPASITSWDLVAMSFSMPYQLRLAEAGAEARGLDGYAPAGQTFFPPAQNTAWGIHSKMMLLDEDKVWVGSYNFDPRSENLNVETAILIQDDALARLVGKSVHDRIKTRSLPLRPDGKYGDGETLGRPIDALSRLKLSIMKVFAACVESLY
jgi:phosphatidylserine/phosphatidylglycerophosphate/cardiolipin synthase-like enzyme